MPLLSIPSVPTAVAQSIAGDTAVFVPSSLAPDPPQARQASRPRATLAPDPPQARQASQPRATSRAAPKPRPTRPFISTTYELINSGVGCRWSQDGASFIVEEDTFAANLKNSNMKSFVRQCNHYGFRKHRLNPGRQVQVTSLFSHPLFLRGRPDLLHQIGPKHEHQRAGGRAAGACGVTSDSSADLVLSLRTRVHELEGKLTETEAKLVTLQDLFQRVTGQKRPRPSSEDSPTFQTLSFGVSRANGECESDGAGFNIGGFDGTQLGCNQAASKRPRLTKAQDSSEGGSTLSRAPSVGSSGLSSVETPAAYAAAPAPASSCETLCDAVCDKAPSAPTVPSNPARLCSTPLVGELSACGLGSPLQEFDTQSDVSDLGSNESLDIDRLLGVMSEVSLDESRSFDTRLLDLASLDGSRSLGSVTSVAVEGQGLKRTASFDVMREMLHSFGNALEEVSPRNVRSDGTSTAPCSVDGEPEGGDEGEGGGNGLSKTELSLRAQ